MNIKEKGTSNSLERFNIDGYLCFNIDGYLFNRKLMGRPEKAAAAYLVIWSFRHATPNDVKQGS